MPGSLTARLPSRNLRQRSPSPRVDHERQDRGLGPTLLTRRNAPRSVAAMHQTMTPSVRIDDRAVYRLPEPPRQSMTRCRTYQWGWALGAGRIV